MSIMVFRWTSAAVGLLGVLVLAGWLLNLDLLKSGVPGLVPMNPATAVGILAALERLGLTPERKAEGRRKVGSG